MNPVHYYVYKITNLINGKIYIGCHGTKDLDDGYMGSGTYLGLAKKKHGVKNFNKEILSLHSSLEEMLTEEARLVNQKFIEREDTYNHIRGGQCGWFGQQLSKEHCDAIARARTGTHLSDEAKKKLSDHFTGRPSPKSKYTKSSSYKAPNSGRTLPAEWCANIKEATTGENNPRAKLCIQDVIQIKARLSISSNKELGIEFGVSSGAINLIRIGKNWKQV